MTNQITTTLWDLDDTLIANDHNFYGPFLESSLIITRDLGQYSPRPEELLALCDRKKKELYQQGGYTKHVNATACIQAYTDICNRFGRPANPNVISALGMAGAKYIRKDYNLYPEAKEVVQSVTVPRIVVTMGDSEVQNYKVDNVGIRPLFNAVRVIPQKFKPNYQGILDEFNLNPANTLMIGNSLKHDIEPCLELGLKTAHLYKHSHRFDAYTDETVAQMRQQYPDQYFPIVSLWDVLPVITGKYAPTN